jgi:hypothetical protein
MFLAAGCIKDTEIVLHFQLFNYKRYKAEEHT